MISISRRAGLGPFHRHCVVPLRLTHPTQTPAANPPNAEADYRPATNHCRAQERSQSLDFPNFPDYRQQVKALYEAVELHPRVGARWRTDDPRRKPSLRRFRSAF